VFRFVTFEFFLGLPLCVQFSKPNDEKTTKISK
jgi:hypothetical protein